MLGVLQHDLFEFAQRARRIAPDEGRDRVTQAERRIAELAFGLTDRERLIPGAGLQALLSHEYEFCRTHARESRADRLGLRDVSVGSRLQLKASSSRSAKGATEASKRSPASVTIS